MTQRKTSPVSIPALATQASMANFTHGDSANVTALAEQIDDCPVLVSLLKMGYAQPSYRSRGQALGELNNWSGTPVQQKDQGFSPTNWPNLRPKK